MSYPNGDDQKPPKPPAGGVILGKGRRDLLLHALGKFGAICSGCGQPIVFKYATPAAGEETTIERAALEVILGAPTAGPDGRQTVSGARLTFCYRGGCQEARAEALDSEELLCFRRVEGYEVRRDVLEVAGLGEKKGP